MEVDQTSQRFMGTFRPCAVKVSSLSRMDRCGSPRTLLTRHAHAMVPKDMEIKRAPAEEGIAGQHQPTVCESPDDATPQDSRVQETYSHVASSPSLASFRRLDCTVGSLARTTCCHIFLLAHQVTKWAFVKIGRPNILRGFFPKAWRRVLPLGSLELFS